MRLLFTPLGTLVFIPLALVAGFLAGPAWRRLTRHQEGEQP